MRKLALGAGAIVLGLLMLELGLRAFGYSAPNWHRLDPQLGWTLRASRYGIHVEHGERTPVRISPAGFRDIERFLDKPEGVYRIAVLGDEYSEALDTRLAQTWWWRLGPRLEACGFPDVEILNFGVGGYSTAQEAVMLESAAMRYRPDLVLVQFSSDDVADNSFSLAKNKLRPFFILDQQGVARIDESFSFDPSFDRFMQTRYQLGVEIADHSRVFQLARQLPDLLSFAPAHAAPVSQVLTAPKDAVWEDAWRVTEQILAHINDYSKRNGARMALATVGASAYARERLTSLGFPVIALPDPFSHAAAAETIARSLCTSRTSDMPGGAQ
jgi:hypothetical protein